MPRPYRTDPCGSTSTSSVLMPRRASAAARLIAVVVLPTPPFWLTIASTRDTLGLLLFGDGVHSGPEFSKRCLCVLNPSLRLRAGRRLRKKCLEMLLCTRAIAALEQQEREAVMRAGELRRELERASITADRVVQPTGLGERDGHVLQYFRIVRSVAQRQSVRRERGVVIPLSLQRQRLAQIIQALRLDVAFRLAAHEAAPPGH